jgi:hypothetical protein
MALTPSGQIAFSDINAEINTVTPMATTAKRAINDLYCRKLSGKSSSTALVSMTDFYGKTFIRQTITKTFTANTSDALFSTADYPDYGAGFTDITITVSPGIWLWATTVKKNGLTISGLTTGDTLSIVNQGYIIGCGGASSITADFALGPFQRGSAAIKLNYTASVDPIINNTYATAYIAGGGGAGKTINNQYNNITVLGGGGAGGGTSAYNFPSPIPGGTIGQPGSDGFYEVRSFTSPSLGYYVYMYGGSGGRVLPGDGGIAPTPISHPDLPQLVNASAYETFNEFGSGGSGGGAGGSGSAFGGSYPTSNNCFPDGNPGAFGGNGGSINSPGGSGSIVNNIWWQLGAGGGGGWGAQGGSAVRANLVGGGSSSGSGCFQYGAMGTPTVIPTTFELGGNAVSTNGRTVTWVSGNTTRVYGAVAA